MSRREDEFTADEATRLTSEKVSYMEVIGDGPDESGVFSCGDCKWLASNKRCRHPAVLAPVDPLFGCCNLFFPSTPKHVLFPYNARPRL